MPPGTERYRSPRLLFLRFVLKLGAREDYHGEPPDDVYALGVTAYRLLAGAYPPRPQDPEVKLDAKQVRLLPPGLGEEVLGSAEKAENLHAAGPAIARKVPKTPFGGLARPPCARCGAVEINGGCWMVPNKEAKKAPCYTHLYEHEGRCYMPVLISEQLPTSDDP